MIDSRREPCWGSLECGDEERRGPFLRFGEGQAVGWKDLFPLGSLDQLREGRAKSADFEQVGTSRGSESCG